MEKFTSQNYSLKMLPSQNQSDTKFVFVKGIQYLLCYRFVIRKGKFTKADCRYLGAHSILNDVLNQGLQISRLRTACGSQNA